jgi:hypothetical protein
MARVIEEKIIDTINNWKDGEYRLSCRDRVWIKNGRATYYLWDSPVVTVYKEIGGEKSVNFCFCGYGSQTTKERISELLWHFSDRAFIFRKNWIHYLKIGNDYYRIHEDKAYTIKDGILFDLIGNKVEPLKDFKY